MHRRIMCFRRSTWKLTPRDPPSIRKRRGIQTKSWTWSCNGCALCVPQNAFNGVRYPAVSVDSTSWSEKTKGNIYWKFLEHSSLLSTIFSHDHSNETWSTTLLRWTDLYNHWAENFRCDDEGIERAFCPYHPTTWPFVPPPLAVSCPHHVLFLATPFTFFGPTICRL